jgi:hypothetical protein
MARQSFFDAVKPFVARVILQELYSLFGADAAHDPHSQQDQSHR